MIPHACPVCGGAQRVPETLYLGSSTAAGTGTVPCRSCKETGVVWEADPVMIAEVPAPPRLRDPGPTPIFESLD